LPKNKSFHAKTQSRQVTAKKSFQMVKPMKAWFWEGFAGSLRLRVSACAFDFLFGSGMSDLKITFVISLKRQRLKA
jgi:hypothetical protein